MKKKWRNKVKIKIIILSVFLITSCSSEERKKNISINPSNEPFTQTSFVDNFDGPIDSKKWQIATWKEHNGQTGVERCYTADGYLHLIFINDSTKGYLSSAIQTREEFLYGKWEARMKPSNISGVLNAMYTIDWDNTSASSASDDGTKQEIDIEFLTFAFSQKSSKVHYAVHAAGLNSFETNPDIEIDFDPSTDFHIWGFEITPEYIEWFVDGKVLLRYNYNENDVAITSPYQLKFNAWSGVHWVKGPPTADIETVFQIDWIKFTPKKH